jgi:hypothetical protein
VPVKRTASDASLARSAEPPYQEIRGILGSVRAVAYRAACSEAVLDDLSSRLTVDFGRGFDVPNLRYTR